MSLNSQLIKYYTGLVRSGAMTPEEVPGPKAMCDEWDVSQSVASKARGILMDRGIAAPRPSLARPLPPFNDMDMAFRFYPDVEPPNEDGCKLWTGRTFNGRYGLFVIGKHGVVAHRVAYQYEVGPIPDGLDIDHVYAWGCRSTLCVNTDHLEAVTHRENQRRRIF
ncbi:MULTISPECIES: HNH endonuclease signature motif containing protein [unclassified Streptomyces]|uniref:HNH endonuclease signature motif containing protein n=1 Tax=unclassified Streptomyces TaxID=2593676 RepID=UPI0036E59625